MDKGIPGGLLEGWEKDGITLRSAAWRRRRSWRRGIEEVYCGWGKVALNIKRKKSSVPMASISGLEHQHPTMSTLWGHRDRSKNLKQKIIYLCQFPLGSFNLGVHV